MSMPDTRTISRVEICCPKCKKGNMRAIDDSGDFCDISTTLPKLGIKGLPIHKCDNNECMFTDNLINNHTLDITPANSLEQISDMIDNYKSTYKRKPDKLLFDSSKRLLWVCDELIDCLDIFNKPVQLDGIKVVFTDVIERQRKYYESLEPIEFWVDHWPQREEI